jgi:hypothetical protein
MSDKDQFLIDEDSQWSFSSFSEPELDQLLAQDGW